MFAHPIINTKATQGEWYAKKVFEIGWEMDTLEAF